MRLKPVVEDNFTTEFEILDSENNWVEGFCGRFAPVDRFLSNFHRPLQRRMLHSSVDDALPVSRVIKNKVTGDVYILGQTRSDDEHGEAYTKISVAHLATNNSSGLAQLNRLVVDDGRPVTTIGELIPSVVGDVYISTEYKTSIENFGTDDVFEDRYIIFAPSSAVFQAEDTLLLNGDSFVVNSSYKDSDFSCAIVTKGAEDRVTGTYRRLTSPYDTATGQVIETADDYLVTCSVNKLQGKLNQGERHGVKSDVEIYLKSPSFPVVPKIGNRFLAKGETFIIRGVSQDQEAAYQWRLYCERAN